MVNAVLDSFNQITREDVATAMEQFNEEVIIHYEYHYKITVLSIVCTVYVVILMVVNNDNLLQLFHYVGVFHFTGNT